MTLKTKSPPLAVATTSKHRFGLTRFQETPTPAKLMKPIAAVPLAPKMQGQRRQSPLSVQKV
jgi:hypothetical protein